MATTRIWLGAILVGLAWGSAAFGQTDTLVPQSTGGLRKLPPPPGEPVPPAATTPAASPTDVLTGQPAAPLPPGSVSSPWCGGSPAGGGCCGPIGANGPITYELVTYTGPNLPTAGGILSRTLNTGWTVGENANSLFFDCSGDAAWVLGLGVSFTYNRGNQRTPLDVFTPAPKVDTSGNPLPAQPDQLNEFVVRAMYRTTFNFSIGRDWFLDGPGITGLESVGNWRIGTDIGGRWGTAHVELVPTADLTNYLKKGSTTYGVYGGFHVTREIPFGGVILYSGFRTEIGYDWMNVVPPQGGDIFNVNLFLNAGVRF